jgi:prepilin-type N-terminal cleavage/methylation domain-containing protein
MKRRGFTLVEMLVTLAVTAIVFALVAVLARDLARADERLRVEMLGGSSVRFAAARVVQEIGRGGGGRGVVETENEIRLEKSDGSRAGRLRFSRNQIARYADSFSDEGKETWAIRGTLTVLESTKTTITLRFEPEGSARVEVFVVPAIVPAEESS